MPFDPIPILAPHCDIVERLALVPSTAQVRGIWFRNIEAEVTRQGLLSPWAEAFPDRIESAYRYYPVSEYIRRLAWAGALVRSPAEVHAGMTDLSRMAAISFSRSLLVRGFLRVLSLDPAKLVAQATSTKHLSANYGTCTVRQHGSRGVALRYESEYVWIESALLGVILGTFESIPLPVRANVQLEDRFNGTILLEW